MSILNNLKLVVIDNAYASWEDSFVQEMYCKIIDLKKRCYGTYFSKYYAPIDKWDFHGFHISFCHEENGEYFPLTSMRIVTNHKCRDYGFPYNGNSLLNSCGSEKHQLALNEFIDQYDKQNMTIGTISGLAFEPNIPSGTTEKREIKNFLLPIFAYSHLQWNLDKSLCIGVCASNLNEVYDKKLGLKPLKYHNEVLPPISIPTAGNELFEVMGLDQIALPALEMAKEFMPLWHDRIHIYDKNVEREEDLVEKNLEAIYSPTLKAA